MTATLQAGPSGQGDSALRLTGLLRQLADDPAAERVAIADILLIMQGRAFGALLMIFAFPNILPSPPGLAGVLGLPLIFLSAQMMLGMAPWLPGIIARRSIARPVFAALVDKIEPWLARAERLLSIRLRPLTSAPAQRVIGAVCLILSIALALPVPFANLAPATAICLIGLGVLERDGLWIILGFCAAVGALVYVAALGYALVVSALYVITNAF
ncbi:exopolysaccharide biosynthesis protein [Neotabrizicola sp. VNH66]|uniref:exopolysaccharide biosynthesis protein n=1 Tax=Neotabrizicola sp. VNH66 TaxID=3400918 RepID=UPI003C2C5F7F